MRGAIKNLLATLTVPVLRALAPAFDDLTRIWAYLVFSASIKHPLDASVVVMGTPEVQGNGNVRVGRNLLIYPGLYIETCDGALIDIGDNVVTSRGVHIVAYAGVSIGAGTMIGEYVSIRDANHLRRSDGALRDGDHFAAAINIGTQVWIGRGVTILPGVSIGNNATVGANAVVTRDVAAGITVVGVPAVPISAKRTDISRNKPSFRTA